MAGARVREPLQPRPAAEPALRRGARPGPRPARATASAPAASRRARERRLAKFRQNVARFRLYRQRSLQANTRFSAFFKIYQTILLNFLQFCKILQILRYLQKFSEF